MSTSSEDHSTGLASSGAGFARLPPGISLPSIRTPHDITKKSSAPRDARRLGLDDYVDAHKRRAMQIFSIPSALPIGPGHPLYARGSELAVLRDENAKLQKDNIDLREQLENEKRHTNPKRV